jgi:hypothetical protein
LKELAQRIDNLAMKGILEDTNLNPKHEIRDPKTRRFVRRFRISDLGFRISGAAAAEGGTG